jgi:transposase-like protein
VLSADALLEDGRPVLLHLDLGPRESYDAWLTFLQDLVARGLRDPLLVVVDGAPGLVKAVNRVWPRAYRQRCHIHYADLRIMPMSMTDPRSTAVLAATMSA